jgi:CIC family chloride channel protein
VVFRASLTTVYRAFYGADNIVDSIARLPPWLRLMVPIAAAAAAGTIARIRSSRTQGVSNVMEAIALGRVQLSLRSTASRVACSWVAIAGGLSIGREGPLIEVGGSLGAAVGRTVRTSLNQTRVLVGAGTAAGFAAAYNTPFAASLFVLETIAGVAAPELLLPVMAATVGAAGIMRATIGAGPIYGQRAFGLESYTELLSFALLGVAAAVVALLFKTVLASLEHWFDTHPVPQPFRATMGGLVVGAIAIWVPAVVGNGYEPLNGILDSGIAVRAVIVARRGQDPRDERLCRVRNSGRDLHADAPRGCSARCRMVERRRFWSRAQRRQLRAGWNGCRHGGQYPRTPDGGDSGVRVVGRLPDRPSPDSDNRCRDRHIEGVR